jgi:hypothetical protein
MSIRTLAVAVAAVVASSLCADAGTELHGASDVFGAPGVAVAWAVLRAPVEDDTQVVIRLRSTDAAYGYVRVDAIDPFSGARVVGRPGGPIAGTTDIRALRRSFADHPRREIRLYRTTDDFLRDAPGLTIYYLGVPDTTPEFVSEAALNAYLDVAIARAKR